MLSSKRMKVTGSLTNSQQHIPVQILTFHFISEKITNQYQVQMLLLDRSQKWNQIKGWTCLEHCLWETRNLKRLWLNQCSVGLPLSELKFWNYWNQILWHHTTPKRVLRMQSWISKTSPLSITSQKYYL